jgi:hypothetical protein
LISIIRKEFIQIFRDPRTLAMILVIPIMQLFLLGLLRHQRRAQRPLAVLDQSRSESHAPCSIRIARRIISGLPMWWIQRRRSKLIFAGRGSGGRDHPAGLRPAPQPWECTDRLHPGRLRPDQRLDRPLRLAADRAGSLHGILRKSSSAAG